METMLLKLLLLLMLMLLLLFLCAFETFVAGVITVLQLLSAIPAALLCRQTA